MRLLLLLLTSVFFVTTPLLAQGNATTDSSGVWTAIDETALLSTAAARGADVASLRNIVPQAYRTLEVNRRALEEVLRSAPSEWTGRLEVTGVELLLPMPDGTFAHFMVQESPLMEPELAKKFPEIKTYLGQGIDDATATVRMDLTPAGFHAIILSPKTGVTYIDPYWRDSDTVHISYRKSDYVAEKPFSCLVDTPAEPVARDLAADLPARPTGAQLRRYRLALACTGEYAVAVSSPNPATVPRALAAMITSANRVSAILERDFALRLVLVANNERLVFLDGTTDPYTNYNAPAMLTENQQTIDQIIGSANYDIGHAFSTGGGGLAYLGVPCSGGFKAGGVSGLTSPTGDPFDVDYVAHEMGHQFGANHTFNSSVGSCSANRNGPTAFEAGSGSTIMSYSGLCGATNIAFDSDDHFHTGSYTEIDNFTSGGLGASCPTSVATGNNPPIIAVLPTNHTIPANTPFALTASATDADGDIVTYAWEQYDGNGPAQSTPNPLSTTTAGPLFRSFLPTIDPTRVFPSLIYILNNGNTPPATNSAGFATGEILPTVARTMNFRVTARDNRAGGGGSNWAATAVTTVATGAPFLVTSPNTAVTYPGGSQQTVTWDVAGTTANGINCANVRILLSTDGGNTFPVVLASSTANNGSAVVAIPQIATTQGRIKVEAVGNIFFDISNANFTITSTNTAPVLHFTASITVVRGQPTPTVAGVGSVSDAESDALSVSVSNLPFGAAITPSLNGTSVTFSAVVDCGVVTPRTSRTYPVTLTVSDIHGASTTGTVNLVVTPNPSPTLGSYQDIEVTQPNTGTSTPSAVAADANGNLGAAPYSVEPATLPGGGSITVDQSTGVVTVTTTSDSTLGTTAVRVTALDSCGAAAVSIFHVNVTSITPLLQPGALSSPTAEGCSPANGAVDPGEDVIVHFPITNNGGGPTTDLVATLQSTGGITPFTTTQNYGAIPAQGSVSRGFQFTASGACGDIVTATLQLQDGPTSYGTISYTIQLGADLSAGEILTQNFDSVTPPALPDGWTANATATPAPAPAPWATSADSPDTSPNSISAVPVERVSDNLLSSPAVAIPTSAAQLSFRHRWLFEDGYDGGRVEMSINGGAYTEIIAAGGEFTSGAYNGVIAVGFNNPIAGSQAWTGSDDGSYTTTVINLPAAALGQSVRFRWRLATDLSASPTGAHWRLDTIAVSGNSLVCATSCDSPPAITSAPPPSPLVVGSAYAHTFTATGQPTPTFSLTSGTLPPGLTLSSSGVLSGTPTSAGNGSFPNLTVTASNGNAPAAQQVFTLTVQTSATNYLASYGVTGPNSGLAEDFDFDGIANVMEYALGLHPNSASLAGLPVIVPQDYRGTRYLSMTFRRSSVARDLTYIVQGSGDLVQWDDLATSTAGGPVSGPGFVQETGSAPEFTVEVRDTVPMNSAPEGKRFLRLRIVPQ